MSRLHFSFFIYISHFSLLISHLEFMKNLDTRRTIRKYAQKPVSDALLNRLLSEASRTQTMGNLQLYSVVVTRSEEMKQR